VAVNFSTFLTAHGRQLSGNLDGYPFLSFGSSASRKESPKRLKPNTPRRIAMPGNVAQLRCAETEVAQRRLARMALLGIDLTAVVAAEDEGGRRPRGSRA
jgi:hypothetical protein